MHYFQPGLETAASATTRIATGLLDTIGIRLSGAQRLSATDVHEIRKTSKRLRALLRLVRPALDQDRFHAADRLVRRLAIRLAQARDATVMRDTLAAVMQHYAPVLPAELFLPVQDWLDREAPLADTAAADYPSAVLHQPLEELRSVIAALPLEAVNIDTLVAGVRLSYRTGRRALARVLAQPDDEPVHALRRHGKYLYNELNMLLAMDRTALTPLVDLSHDIEHTLGQVHDLSMLLEFIRHSRAARQDPLRREVITSVLETRWLRQLSGTLNRAQHLYQRKPRVFAAWLQERLTSATD